MKTREEKNAYARAWRKRNPQKTRGYSLRRWEKLQTLPKEERAEFLAKQRKATRKWQDSHPEKVREYRVRMKNRTKEYEKNRHMRTAYGLSPHDYGRLLKEQEGRCAICRESKSLVVDHCHKTDKVRQLLCKTCNQGLGLFHDRPEKLRAAVGYLISHSEPDDFRVFLT